MSRYHVMLLGGRHYIDTLDTAFQSFVGFQRVQTAETTKDERDNHLHGMYIVV